jgi:hypothetical protein
MKKLFTNLLLTLAGVATLANIGCKSDSPKGEGGVAGGIALTPSADGFYDGTNDAGILGAWYSYGDWYAGMPAMGGAGDCPTKGMFTAAQCSVIESPIPGQPFVNTGKLCTKGTAAKVIMDSTGATAYSAVWGTGIGFDMNNAGTDDGGTGVKGTWSAPEHGVTGFSFTIESPPVGGQMRVEFPTNAVPGGTDINSAYWGGASMNLSPFTTAGTHSFHWKDVGGPMYLTGAPAFDNTKILSMQFHVVTNTSSTVPFDYCISNLTALTD